ncbi:xanthine dehydrogenase accessory protein XdhC [Truepera radiovictrix]|uniref:Xanthine dehydrogenase accessory protein XdhC n=1 Tax=Truepera radiovictrix (strain DSM 17093 / CIP 108686 / LMG 22925 / RQ-24) TaxID=649638 RepID=D7CXN1_TRURR|nr:xanthine dehydrogenase accessory protein XdhC [Truepera radiovictrix]ADI14633.1 xanthine dehydrogenase accessory protein XdhC [Truepera radiovictrix DSM 17093]WMT56817.1 xanthine dehydrogenase accessory protein XdhC [Truepera radiovictrix]
MSWLAAAAELARAGTPFVLVTLARVRGHAPRRAGSKMVVTAREAHGSVGGGNLEATATARARELLASGARDPELLSLPLGPQGGAHGVQCCGGEVTLLLEPFALARPSVALFGAGHVGWALVQVLGTLPLNLHLIDSRASALARPLPSPLAATLTRHHAPVPESALAALPAGTHLLILTHDHAEDLAVLERALRGPFGMVGLIGSASKWAHFRRELARQGLSETDLARVVTPIGDPELGKSPPAIAIGVAAQLLSVLELPEGLF